MAPAASGTRARGRCQTATTDRSGCAPLGSRRPRLRALACPLSPRRRAKFARLEGGGHRTTEPGLGRATPARARTGVKAGEPGLGAQVCSSDPSGLDGAQSAAGAGLRDPAGAVLGLRTPSGLGESGERRPFGSDPCPWPRAGMRGGSTHSPSLQLCGETCVSSPQLERPAELAWPSLPRDPRVWGCAWGSVAEGPRTEAGPGQSAALVLPGWLLFRAISQCSLLESH